MPQDYWYDSGKLNVFLIPFFFSALLIGLWQPVRATCTRRGCLCPASFIIKNESELVGQLCKNGPTTVGNPTWNTLLEPTCTNPVQYVQMLYDSNTLQYTPFVLRNMYCRTYSTLSIMNKRVSSRNYQSHLLLLCRVSPV